MKIELPYKIVLRPYQSDVWNMFDKFKRFVMVRHRRAGKDKVSLQLLIRGAFERVGVYYYVFPEYAQGRKIFWDWIDKDGFRNIDHLPKAMVASMNEHEMKITFVNWSIIQVVGTDRKIDNVVGTNPVWVVFSEYSIQNPTWWNLIRPILNENWGWAMFIYTPRGKNHWWDLCDMAKRNDKWFVSIKTVDDTTDWEGKRVLWQNQIDDELESWMTQDLVDQEYYCSFEASIQGAYYSIQMREARESNRITKIPIEEGLEVNTYWDLGVDDSTAIRFTQQIGKEVRMIDYYENNWEGLAFYVELLKKKGYFYGMHYLPHDVEVVELGTGKSRYQTLKELGIWNIKTVPRPRLKEHAIDAVRRMLKYCWFDEVRCELGVEALKSYHKVYDEKRKAFSKVPKHDWSSHWADAFSYLAIMVEKDLTTVVKETKARRTFMNPLTGEMITR